MAKAFGWNGLDDEERRLGEQTGLDTRVVLAVNDADCVLQKSCAFAVLKGNC